MTLAGAGSYTSPVADARLSFMGVYLFFFLLPPPLLSFFLLNFVGGLVGAPMEFLPPSTHVGSAPA